MLGGADEKFSAVFNDLVVARAMPSVETARAEDDFLFCQPCFTLTSWACLAISRICMCTLHCLHYVLNIGY